METAKAQESQSLGCPKLGFNIKDLWDDGCWTDILIWVFKLERLIAQEGWDSMAKLKAQLQQANHLIAAYLDG